MILIFEGCDCVGKTYLINRLLKNSTIEFNQKTVVKHFTNPPKCKNQRQYIQFEYTNEIIKLNIFHKELNFIYDRFYIGELVYAPIYRKYKPINIEFIEKALNKMNAILIYVYADVKTIENRFDGKFIKKNHINKILTNYKKVLYKSKLNNIIYINTTKLTKEQAYNTLMREIWT